MSIIENGNIEDLLKRPASQPFNYDHNTCDYLCLIRQRLIFYSNWHSLYDIDSNSRVPSISDQTQTLDGVIFLP